jgi:surfeit locus 1 family protein
MSQLTSAWKRILMLLVAAAGVAVTSSLGVWQLGRAAEKIAFQAAQTQQEALAPIDGETLGAVQDTEVNRRGLIHRRIELKGRWLAEHTVYLENRQMKGRPGFLVMTPLKMAQTGVVILVQRGWAPRSFTDRSALPSLQTQTGEVVVTGHLAPWPSRLYDFGGVEEGSIRQNLDLPQYQQQTGLPLLEVSVQQTGPESEGLLREWPVVASGVEKHYGYAFQWFGLSALIALLYVWFQIVQPRRKKTAD